VSMVLATMVEPLVCCLLACCQHYGHHRGLRSFPTRRSSDLSGSTSAPIIMTAGTASFGIPYTDIISISPINPPLGIPPATILTRSEEHTSELQSRENLVCRLLLEKKKKKNNRRKTIFILILT